MSVEAESCPAECCSASAECPASAESCSAESCPASSAECGVPQKTKFRIQKHGRLQELIAHDKGYFRDEGLDYEFGDFLSRKIMGNIVDRLKPLNDDGSSAVAGTVDVKTGMFETYKAGRACDVSSACHWAINEAATARFGRMWGQAYSVTPCAIMVPPDSPVRKPADLAGVEVAVGYHSGSHFATVQCLEAFLKPEDIKLKYVGMPWDRVDALLQGTVPAACIWGVGLSLLDQQGFRRVADATFMIGFIFDHTSDPEDLARYFRGLQRAQADLDMEPEKYKHYHLDEIPERLRELSDVRGFGTGERIVFQPYTREMYERSQRWLRERHLFDEEHPIAAYETVVWT